MSYNVAALLEVADTFVCKLLPKLLSRSQDLRGTTADAVSCWSSCNILASFELHVNTGPRRSFHHDS